MKVWNISALRAQASVGGIGRAESAREAEVSFRELLERMDGAQTEKSAEAKAQEGKTTTRIITKPNGERVLMIQSPYGARYIKLGEADDFLLSGAQRGEGDMTL